MSDNLDSIMPAAERERMWQDFMSGHDSLSDDLWRLVVLSLWQQRWMTLS